MNAWASRFVMLGSLAALLCADTCFAGFAWVKIKRNTAVEWLKEAVCLIRLLPYRSVLSLTPSIDLGLNRRSPTQAPILARFDPRLLRAYAAQVEALRRSCIWTIDAQGTDFAAVVHPADRARYTSQQGGPLTKKGPVPSASDAGRCRMHGGMSPGPPKGATHDRDGDRRGGLLHSRSVTPASLPRVRAGCLRRA